MTNKEARRIIDKYYRTDNITPDDDFRFIEACSFLIDTENDTDAMVSLGGLYYEQQKYNLAEKYYLMADANGDKWAANGLGFIYYYGRNGERDYKKAFHYFNIAKNNGNLEAAMKLADMYHNGYGVDKDDNKYKLLLLEIYDQIKDTTNLFDPYPEVAHRLADIYINEGYGEDAGWMLIKAKSFIEQRIRYNPFWGNFIVCRRTITLLYKVIEFDENNFNFFDLFYVLSKPNKVKLTYHANQYIIESFYDEGELRVKCEDRYYKSIENFLINAKIDNKHIYVIEYEDNYILDIINY